MICYNDVIDSMHDDLACAQENNTASYMHCMLVISCKICEILSYKITRYMHSVTLQRNKRKSNFTYRNP